MKGAILDLRTETREWLTTPAMIAARQLEVVIKLKVRAMVRPLSRTVCFANSATIQLSKTVHKRVIDIPVRTLPQNKSPRLSESTARQDNAWVRQYVKQAARRPYTSAANPDMVADIPAAIYTVA
jgi:hypothetical protein